eukprot:19846-Rhodomonas_salina.1
MRAGKERGLWDQGEGRKGQQISILMQILMHIWLDVARMWLEEPLFEDFAHDSIACDCCGCHAIMIHCASQEMQNYWARVDCTLREGCTDTVSSRSVILSSYQTPRRRLRLVQIEAAILRTIMME